MTAERVKELMKELDRERSISDHLIAVFAFNKLCDECGCPLDVHHQDECIEIRKEIKQFKEDQRMKFQMPRTTRSELFSLISSNVNDDFGWGME